MEIIETIKLACGEAHLIELDDGALIQTGDIFLATEHRKGGRPYRFADLHQPGDCAKRVMTIATMAGCPMGCTFCAARNSFVRNLSADEIVAQVETMRVDGVGRRRHHDPNMTCDFSILLTRSGEPLANAGEAVAAMRRLHRQYPRATLGLSTSGVAVGVEQLLAAVDLVPSISLRIAIHSMDETARRALLGSDRHLTLAEISSLVKRWRLLGGSPVGLDFILLHGHSYDFVALHTLFSPADVWIRLSPLNPVRGVDAVGMLQADDLLLKKPTSSHELKEAVASLRRSGFDYAYVPPFDEEARRGVGYGQDLQAFDDA